MSAFLVFLFERDRGDKQQQSAHLCPSAPWDHHDFSVPSLQGCHCTSTRGICFLWTHSVPLVKVHSHCKPQKSGACHKHLEYSYVAGSMTSSWVLSLHWFGLSESSVLNCVRPVLTIEKCRRSLSSVSESLQLCHLLHPYSPGAPLLQCLCCTCSHTSPGLSFRNKRGIVSAR